MSSTQDFSPEWNGFRRWYWIVAALLALLLLLLWFTGFGPGGTACKRAMVGYCAENAPVAAVAAPAATAVVAPVVAPVAAPVAVAASAAVVPAPEPAVAVAVAAPAAVALPAAVIYFASDKFNLPAGSSKKLADVVSHLKANPNAKVALSGFHDPAGNLAANQELAHNRARAVRTSLEAAGIAKDRVVMEKPAVTVGGGAPQEARRVEVSVRAE